MFNYLFASYYKLFLKTKDDTPIYASVLMISITIVAWFMFILGLLRKYNIYNAFTIQNGKYFIYPIMFALLFFLYRFYRKERVSRILKTFDEKSLILKYIWAAITIIMLILPIVSSALLANNYIK